MISQLCFHCFRKKGSRKVCPYCGYVQQETPEQAYQLTPGTILHKRYIMGTSIGIGGFGITYRALDVTLRLIVAVKEFYPAGLVNRGEREAKVGIFSGEKEGEFRRQLDRFLEEARNMAVFSKEQDIVNVYDYFEENQTAYIIMEYVDAPLLKDRLRKGKMPVEEACGYMFSLLEALGKVHRQGIIHKDISPDNIFLTGPDTVKLFDFGAAKFRETETERTVSVVVKSGYTPPEQYSANSKQQRTMDIYAAGAVFYEMLTGEKPVDALDRIASDELKRPGDFKIKVDEYLERIILKAMALDPQMRFPSVEEFQKAMEVREKVELPEEILRKHNRLKRILSVSLAIVTVTAGSIVLLSQTVFSSRGKIDMHSIQAEELSVWLRVQEEDEGEELVQAFCQSIEKECPQLTVDVEAVREEAYADRLKQAMEQGTLPDVFCIDSIAGTMLSENEEQISDFCAELTRLLHTMNLSSYIYLNQLEKRGTMYALPMSLQLGIAYVNKEKEEEPPEFAELSVLADYAAVTGYADEQNVFTNFEKQDSRISWIIGDLSDLEQVEAVTVENVPSTDFAALPILEDGKLTGCLKDWYGVKKSGDANRENAGMVLLSILLSDGMQSKTYMDNGEGMPLNRTVFESYKENKLTTYLSCLNGYDLEDVQLSDDVNLCDTIRGQTGGNGT